MLRPSCSKAQRLLLESEGGLLGSADGLWLEDHLAGCASCRLEGRDLSRLLGAWRDATPPTLRTAERERLEEAALAYPVAARAPRASVRAPRWRWVALGGVAAAAAVAGILWLLPATSSPGALSVQGGAGAVATASPRVSPLVWSSKREPTELWGAQVRAKPEEPAHLRTSDGRLKIGLRGGSLVRFERVRGGGVVHLSRGGVAAELDPNAGWTLAVRLPDGGEVQVLGTRFVVELLADGAVLVEVLRGRVRYRYPVQGQLRQVVLTAGQRVEQRGSRVRRSAASPARIRAWLEPAVVQRLPRPAAATTPPRTPASTPTTGRPRAAAPRPDCRAQQVRTLLARGQAGRALRVIADCRKAGRAGRELRTLEADAHLRAGHTAAALQRYLELARRYRGTLAGQNALFAAAQVARFRLGRRAQGERLLRRYLREYPRGLYRADVERLLK